MYPILQLDTLEEKEAKCAETLAVIEKEIEPLLSDASPFFRGSEKMTMAEVIVAPFLLRMYAISNDELFPKSFKAGVQKLPNTGKWAEAVLKQESVLYIWDEKAVVENTGKRIAKMKALKAGGK